jgi:hypothetical protein
MKIPSSATLRKIKRGIALAALAGFLAGPPCVASGAADTHRSLTFPEEYGKVIYRKEGNPDRDLYIICQSHRNAETGANGVNTAAVQADIYRIGEWLVQNKDVKLLLPEGYFCRSDSQEAGGRQAESRPKENFVPRSLDDAALKAALNDTSIFVNADKLLQQSYNLKLQQVENRKIYFSVLDILFRSQRHGDLDGADLQRLNYLQEKRSAVMLQTIPGAISQELQRAGIASRRAIFTIGMAHVNEIIRFLREGKIDIDSPLVPKGDIPEELELAKENYTVTVILPRVLAEDQEAMQIADLDRM